MSKNTETSPVQNGPEKGHKNMEIKVKDFEFPPGSYGWTGDKLWGQSSVLLVNDGRPTEHAYGPFWEALAFLSQNGDENFSNIFGRIDNVDFSHQGSLLVEPDETLSHQIRGGNWRSQLGETEVRENDVRTLYFSSEVPNFLEAKAGGELELKGWDKSRQDTFPIMGPNSEILIALFNHNKSANGHERNGVRFEELEEYDIEVPSTLNVSHELMQMMLEVNFIEENDPIKRGIAQIRALRKISRIANEHDVQILPISMLPHRKLELDDVSEDPYVKRIALDHMKWEYVRLFLGSSFQTHVEIDDTESALRAVNYLQQTSPLLLGISSAGPFVSGKVNPSVKDFPGLENDPRAYQSLRLFGREAGSPSGGVNQLPAPDTVEEFLWLGNRRLISQDIMSLARTLGHHTSLRFRIDIPPKGTIEYADADSFGAHTLKLSAFQEFNKALTKKLEFLIYSDREHEIPQELFGTLDLSELQKVRHNMAEVSKDGMAATIIDPNGNEVQAQNQLYKLLDWVSEPMHGMEYDGLPEGVKEELEKSALLVQEEDFQEYNPHSEDFLNGFYESGLGTLSQWLHRRAIYLLLSNQSERHVVIQLMNELTEAWENHIQNPDLEDDLIYMFNGEEGYNNHHGQK